MVEMEAIRVSELMLQTDSERLEGKGPAQVTGSVVAVLGGESRAPPMTLST